MSAERNAAAAREVARRDATVAALRRERAAMDLHGKAARVEAIDAALAELGELVEVPAPEQAAPKRRRTAAAD